MLIFRFLKDINSKIKNSSERALKGYAIAKLYHTVGDYESARRHLATYLLEKDTSAVAHKLQGEILEKLGQPERALPAYKKAHVSLICSSKLTFSDSEISGAGSFCRPGEQDLSDHGRLAC